MSLLVESEGGQAEEVVDEENGILISAMLRQYFMALRTVGKWNRLSEHWETVASMLKNTQTVQSMDQQATATSPTSPEVSLGRSNSWQAFISARLGYDKPPYNEEEDDNEELEAVGEGSPSGDFRDSAEVGAEPDQQIDVELLLMRKFWARWVEKAGVESKICDPVLGSCVVDWTRLITPVLEGRIKIVGASD
jgi:hypothetical protein